MWEKFKKLITKDWLMLLVIIANYAEGVYLAPRMNEKVPIHWNIQGQPNGYASKEWAIFGIPSIILGLYLLMLILPKIDPKRKNYKLFEGTYYAIRLSLVLVFATFYAVSTTAAIGYNVKMDVVIPLVISMMFVIFGNYMGKIRQNFFVGVKTPWTLSDPEIWAKTHRLTGKLWTIGGLILVTASLLLNGIMKAAVFIGVIGVIAFYPILHSYLLFRGKNSEK